MARVSTQTESHQTTITVDGDFVFDVNREFREAYRQAPADRNFVVDLSKAPYMDSAGLGMLIQLRDYAGSGKARVRLTGVNDTIRNILNVANFERLFDIA